MQLHQACLTSRSPGDWLTGQALVDPLLSAAQVATLRQITSGWLVQQTARDGADWSVPDGQPDCIHALAALGTAIIGDKDAALWPALLRGVPTGFDNGLPASNVFAPRDVGRSICSTSSGGQGGILPSQLAIGSTQLSPARLHGSSCGLFFGHRGCPQNCSCAQIGSRSARGSDPVMCGEARGFLL